ncbi:MAG: peptidase MA family metallohydrolase [Anaerolineae bacterium]
MRIARLELGIFAFLVSLVGSLMMPVCARGDGIEVTENSVEYSFAQHVTFTLEASFDTEITEIYLFFHATHDEETEKTRVTVEQPAREISIRHTHDVRRYPLPPFADISYWWQIEDATGEQHKIDPKWFRYTDNRFSWEHLRPDGIAIHWIKEEGDPAFSQTALDIAQASLKDINAELRAPIPDSFDIFIYNSEHNLEAAMVLTGREWAGGQARPELGAVVVAVPPEQGYTSRMKRYLPHEITHLLVYQLVTPEGYRYVPEWLDEGLATANERLPTPEYALALEEARQADQLLPIEDLCVPFSPDPRTAVLSYAQSASVVQFVRQRHGADGIRRLLSAYANGASCTSGVEEALEVSFGQLENDWRVSLEPKARWRVWVDQAGVWVGLWLLSLIIALPMIGGVRRRQSRTASGSRSSDRV